MSDEAVCRIAPATPGLLTSRILLWISIWLQEHFKIHWSHHQNRHQRHCYFIKEMVFIQPAFSETLFVGGAGVGREGMAKLNRKRTFLRIFCQKYSYFKEIGCNAKFATFECFFVVVEKKANKLNLL